MDRFSKLSDEELVFTAPMSIASADAPAIREAICELIEKVSTRIERSPSEKLACLNMDWVNIEPT
jgi:hypothetical protein